MKKMKFVAIAACLALSAGLIAGCSSNSGSGSSSSSNQQSEQQADKAPTGDVEMSYISVDDVKAAVDAKDENVVLVDVRKAADYEAGHIPGSINADMDAAKGGDTESGIENMKAALKEATGDETGAGEELVLICYSGKSYAQAGTNALSAIGAEMDNVKTLEGGMKAWDGKYADVKEA